MDKKKRTGHCAENGCTGSAANQKCEKPDTKPCAQDDPKEQECCCSCGEHSGANTEALEKEVAELKSQLNEKSGKCDEIYGMLQRAAAEFDNYKKRTAREKEGIYLDAVCDVVSAFLPVIDNLERALQAADSSEVGKSLKDGVELVYKQVKEVLKNLGVEEIKGVGEQFDPNLHNAVMHIEDESYGENVIVEEFQKGFIVKDKVIRHSMVKVVN